MAYAIMRCKKLASMGSAAAALKHCYRERETANADASKTPQNEHQAARSTDEAMGKLRDLLPEKRRKDAVLAVEYLMTASPEWWKQATPEQQQAFFQRSRQWLADKYGEQNIIAATIHRDETSPHMSAFVVPLTKDGRLSAKEFIGNKTQMSRDQSTYAERVADLGLQRGIEGSKAKHVTIQRYYARASEPTPPAPQLDVPEPGIKDRLNPGDYGRKVAESVIEQIRPTWSALQAKAREKDAAEQRAREAASTAKQAQTEAQQQRDRADKLKDTADKLYQVASLFTPEEVKAAQERKRQHDQEQARKAEIAAEKQRRLQGLQALLQRGGATHTLGVKAAEALRKCGGDHTKVDWRGVEAQTVMESMAKHGQSAESVIDAINRHSPGRADPASHQEIRDSVARHAPRLQAEYQQARAERNRGPSMDR
ncbi:MobV family relaxase [Comamonas thiooxydans]|nr:MobV family relaxase [Comamonas thiooxydans]CUB02159.1 Plasmid recombination enzyme [Comamonas thiooxydans]